MSATSLTTLDPPFLDMRRHLVVAVAERVVCRGEYIEVCSPVRPQRADEGGRERAAVVGHLGRTVRQVGRYRLDGRQAPAFGALETQDARREHLDDSVDGHVGGQDVAGLDARRRHHREGLPAELDRCDRGATELALAHGHDRADDADARAERRRGEHHGETQRIGGARIVAGSLPIDGERRGRRHRRLDGEHAAAGVAVEVVVEAEGGAQALRRRGETGAHVPLAAAGRRRARDGGVVARALAGPRQVRGDGGEIGQCRHGGALALLHGEGADRRGRVRAEIALKKHEAVERSLDRLQGVQLAVDQVALVAPGPEQAGRAQAPQVHLVRRSDRADVLGARIGQGLRREPLEGGRLLALTAKRQHVQGIRIGHLQELVEQVADRGRGELLPVLARGNPVDQEAGGAHLVDIVGPCTIGSHVALR